MVKHIADADRPEIAELILDPRVYRTLWPWSSPPTHADIRAGLVDKREHWERHGFGLWLLRDQATGEMVGRGDGSAGGVARNHGAGCPAVRVTGLAPPDARRSSVR